MSVTPFHIAVPVRDLGEARAFYGDLLGFPEGRSDSHWIDYNMYGHQFVVHLNAALGPEGKVTLCHNDVDGHGVPVPHCGVVLTMVQWQTLADRLRSAGVEFVIEPYIRFVGQPGEQATMFFMDPSGNALEFKAFADIDSQLFAS
ncbi:VOC family protein [Aestuariirhabdus sp. LZHN29]|uniref:VOC family protein n=1 Tax=Aestuariirhabdus sp. LZHN29 TaxID=3417462 RepID=UPI003CE9837B